jgi:hypothetical protein
MARVGDGYITAIDPHLEREDQVDQNQVGKPSSGTEEGGGTASRRKFLRQFGMAGAAVAAFVGITDVAGLSSAFAASKSPSSGQAGKTKTVRMVSSHESGAAHPDCESFSSFFQCTPGHCGGPCPKGYWCYYFTGPCHSYGYHCRKTNYCYTSIVGRTSCLLC